MSIRLIRCANSEEVTPYDDAVVFHSAKGHDYTGSKRGGIFYKVYNQMNFIRDNVNHKFIVKDGMGMLYGRQVEIPQNETIEFDVSSLRSQYCVIYVEISNSLGASDGDDDVLDVNCRLTYSSLSVPTVGNTDLIANRYGTATMPLYSFFIDANGQMGEITDLRYVYLPGVAERARMMTGDDVVNNRQLKNLIFSDKDMVRHTDHTYYADRATSLGSTGTATTRNKIDDNLYMPNRDSYILTSHIYPIKTDGTSWAVNTEQSVSGFPTSVKGNIVHVEVFGSDESVGCGYLLKSALSGTSSSVNFELICNGMQTTGSGSGAIQVDIKLSNGVAKVKPQGRALTGTLYLLLFIVGYK